MDNLYKKGYRYTSVQWSRITKKSPMLTKVAII